MKRHLIPLFVITVMILSAFAGCTVNKEQVTTTATTTAATTAVTTAETTTVTTTTTPAATTAAAPVLYDPATDWPYGLNTAMSVRNVVPTDIGYYMILTNFLFYMDADAMEPVPVCAKPNCLHYNEEKIERLNACDAFMNTMGTQASLSYSNGKLWYVGQVRTVNDPEHLFQYALQSMEPDGSARDIVYRFDPTCNVDNGVLHRGVFYVVLNAYDEEVRSKASLLACSLTDTRKEPECVLETEYFGGAGGFIGLTAYGDWLYFYRYTSEERDREFCSFDTNTGELNVIPIADERFAPVNVATFIGDKMYLTCRTAAPQGDLVGEEAYPERLYHCGLDGSDMELLFEGWGDYVSDQEYLYRVPNYVSVGPEDHLVDIYDADGQEVDSVDLAALVDTESIWETGVMLPPGDQTLLWIEVGKSHDVRMYLYWFDKAEIGSGEIVVHPICNYSMTANSSTPGSEVFDFDTAGMREMAAAAIANKAE